MAAHDFEWFLQNAEAYDSLTADQINILGNGGTIEYDATAPVEQTATDPVTAAPAMTDEPTTATPAVLAKDGVNLIPFSELETARARTAELEILAKDQSALIESLQTAKKADAGTGDTTAQDDVLKEFKEQYPDIAALLAPALQKIIESGTVKTAEMERKFTEALTPIQESAKTTEYAAHFKAVTDVVSDFEALRDSGEVDKWIGTLPSYVKSGAERVMAEGTASEVIELFTQYKKANGLDTATPPPAGMSKEEAAAKAAEVVAKARTNRPTSSSDIPSASVNAEDGDPTTVDGWSRKFAGMSPEAILKQL